MTLNEENELKKAIFDELGLCGMKAKKDSNEVELSADLLAERSPQLAALLVVIFEKLKGKE